MDFIWQEEQAQALELLSNLEDIHNMMPCSLKSYFQVVNILIKSSFVAGWIKGKLERCDGSPSQGQRQKVIKFKFQPSLVLEGCSQ